MNCKCGNIPLRGKDICLTCFLKEDAEKQTKSISHEEDDMQECFFSSARVIFPKLDKLLFAVPNGGKRNYPEAVRLKRQGVKKGVADIICLVPNERYSFLCMETKTDTGTQLKDQVEFQKQVEAAGGLYMIYRSAAMGIEILKDYLSTTKYK